MDRWLGKIAVVTGASAGIGAAVVRDLSRAGLVVVGLARRVERVEALAEELKNEKGKVHAIKCDVTKDEDVKQAFTWIKNNLGGVDVLINNAGISRLNLISDADNLEALRSVIDTNLWAVILCTKQALASLKERDVPGHIFNINSVVGHSINISPETPPMSNIYPASKYAITALTESLRIELTYLKSKVKVTSISPGAVETEILDAAGFSQYFKTVPCLQPEDVASTIMFALGTPPHLVIHELTLRSIGGTV